MKTIILSLIISICLTVANCLAQDTPTAIDMVEKKVKLSAFEAIIIKSAGDIYLHYSPNAKVELKGAASCVEETELKVSSGTLIINAKDGFSNHCKIETHIFTPLIKAIQQHGGGRIVIKEGFAPIDAFNCRIDGGGKIKMTALVVDSVLASIKGGGEISAQVSKKLHGKIEGGGMIYYQGNPAVTSNISGGGAIKRKRYEK